MWGPRALARDRRRRSTATFACTTAGTTRLERRPRVSLMPLQPHRLLRSRGWFATRCRGGPQRALTRRRRALLRLPVCRRRLRPSLLAVCHFRALTPLLCPPQARRRRQRGRPRRSDATRRPAMAARVRASSRPSTLSTTPEASSIPRWRRSTFSLRTRRQATRTCAAGASCHACTCSRRRTACSTIHRPRGTKRARSGSSRARMISSGRLRHPASGSTPGTTWRRRWTDLSASRALLNSPTGATTTRSTRTSASSRWIAPSATARDGSASRPPRWGMATPSP